MGTQSDVQEEPQVVLLRLKLGSFFTAFPSPLAGSCIKSGAARTQIQYPQKMLALQVAA